MVRRSPIRLVSGLVVSVGATLLASCAAGTDSTEAGVDPSSGTGSTSGSGSGGAAGSPGLDTTSSGGGPTAAPIDWPTALQCPRSAPQILVFDFRSGWWDDYLYPDVVLDTPKPVLEALAQACDGMTVEYHHVIEGEDEIRCVTSPSEQVCDATPIGSEAGLAATLKKPSLDDYTQLWILSGSNDDGGVTESSQLFVEFLAQTKGSCLPVFIGGGDGNVRHANTVASTLGLDHAFSSSKEAGIAIPAHVVPVQATMTANPSHVLFQNVDELADVVMVVAGGMDQFDPFPISGDRIADNPALYEIIATDATSNPAIAVGGVMLDDGDVRPFVLDAGIQRYYAMFDHAPTLTFLRNVALLLGSVGCKADIPR
jgi:hypothetical protein